jgi:hypothetical protein
MLLESSFSPHYRKEILATRSGTQALYSGHVEKICPCIGKIMLPESLSAVRLNSR